MTSPEGNGRQENAEVSWGPPIVAYRLITILKPEQAARGEAECIVYEEENHVTKEHNEFANSFS